MTKTYYRVRQLTRSLRPCIDKAELSYIKSVLTEKQAELFFRLPLFEQRHALNVCQTLVAGGFGYDVELLQAALLHDLGKTDSLHNRSIPLWGKVANVVLRKLGGPALVTWLASTQPASLRYIFYLQCRHEKRGAKLIRQIGSSNRVVALVGRCSNLIRKGDMSARALKWADDLN